jgi:hypothetical protein
MSYFQNLNLSFPDGDNDINSWADYCELMCLISDGKSITIDSLKDRLLDQFQRDFKKSKAAIGLSSSSTGKFIISTTAFFDEESDNTLDSESLKSDFDDIESSQRSNDGQLEDEISSEFLFLFRFLEGRQNFYDSSYPFQVERKENKLILKTELTPRQRLYLAFLISSVLRIFSPAIRNTIGHLFEEATLYAFKSMIAREAQIGFFGSGNSQDALMFNGSFFNKVTQLANVLQTDTTTSFKQNSHDHEHNGDGGLDWVAWLPFSDGRSKIPVYFAQCACGNNWIDKEWDAHEDKWRNYIQLKDSYIVFHFVGKSFRKQDGEWYKPDQITKLVLIDRPRLLCSISESDIPHVSAIYDDLIDEAVNLVISNGE